MIVNGLDNIEGAYLGTQSLSHYGLGTDTLQEFENKESENSNSQSSENE